MIHFRSCLTFVHLRAPLRWCSECLFSSSFIWILMGLITFTHRTLHKTLQAHCPLRNNRMTLTWALAFESGRSYLSRHVLIYTAAGRASPACRWISTFAEHSSAVQHQRVCPCGNCLCHTPSKPCCLPGRFRSLWHQAGRAPQPRAGAGAAPPEPARLHSERPEGGRARPSSFCHTDKIRDGLSDLVNHWPPENVT